MPDSEPSLVDEEYFRELMELYNKNNPGHTLTKSELFLLVDWIIRAVQLWYRPIPKEKEAEYLEALEYVKRHNTQN